MLRHYFNITFRNLLRNKVVSSIKILGLAVGLCAFILGTSYYRFEKTFDKHNAKYERIYRVQYQKKDDHSFIGQNCSAAVSVFLNEKIPEVEESVMFEDRHERFSTLENKVLSNIFGAYTEKEIMHIFDFHFIAGSKSGFFDKPNAIAISESFAQKLFPDENPMGRTILNHQKKELEITAIFKDLPENTNIPVDFLLPFDEYFKYAYTQWDNTSYYCFALLKSKDLKPIVDDKIRLEPDKHEKYNTWELYLHPLSEVHLNPERSPELGIVLKMIFGITLLILVLSGINYMNLAIANTSNRFKEIGVRKTTGSSKFNLRFQYLFESLIHTILALIIGILLAKAAITPFSHIVDREMELHILSNVNLLLTIVGVAILSGFLSGAYPAFVLSSFKPLYVLKGLSPFGNKKSIGSGLKTSVYIQFILSTILISGSVWTYQNVNYLLNKDLGFEKDQLLYCEIPDNNKSTINYFDLKQRIEKNSGIESMCISKNAPLCMSWGTGVYFEGQDESTKTPVRPNPVGKDFIETYGIKLLDGANFKSDFKMNELTCIINKKAVDVSGWDGSPIGKWVFVWGKKYRVVGVVDNFIEDMHNPLKPYIFLPHDGNITNANSFTVKINPNSTLTSIQYVQKVFAEVFPQVLFDVKTYNHSIDDDALKIWSSVKNTMGFFTVIAILIAGFGLFALILFSVQKRFKELGIRKVNGAKERQIYAGVLNRFMVMLIIAAAVSVPVPIIFQTTMPGAYKYMMQPIDYLIIFSISLAVVLVSGSYIAIKASRMNPVDALRYE